jgi:hypothetical protein
VKGPKKVANLGDFFLKKANLRILWVKSSLNRAFSVKYFKNMTYFSLGWQPGLHRSGMCQ